MMHCGRNNGDITPIWWWNSLELFAHHHQFRNFIFQHPEFTSFVTIFSTKSWTESYAFLIIYKSSLIAPPHRRHCGVVLYAEQFRPNAAHFIPSSSANYALRSCQFEPKIIQSAKILWRQRLEIYSVRLDFSLANESLSWRLFRTRIISCTSHNYGRMGQLFLFLVRTFGVMLWRLRLNSAFRPSTSREIFVSRSLLTLEAHYRKIDLMALGMCG